MILLYKTEPGDHWHVRQSLIEVISHGPEMVEWDESLFLRQGDVFLHDDGLQMIVPIPDPSTDA